MIAVRVSIGRDSGMQSQQSIALKEDRMESMQLALSGSGLMPQAIEQLSKPMQRQASRELERTVAQGLVVNMREQVRAFVTNTALQNTGALSDFENHLCKIAPSGAPRYKHIVDAYALGAAQAITRL